jgi:hypothetical protein
MESDLSGNLLEEIQNLAKDFVARLGNVGLG